MREKSSNSVHDTLQIRQEIVDVCIYLQEIGYFVGTWGNIAVRTGDGFLVTPSRIDYSKMKPKDLVVVSWDGEKIRGERLPSSEMNVHRLILKKRTDLGALIHTHSPFATIVACAHRKIPVLTEEMSQIIGGEVRCTKYIPAGRHLAFAEEASKIMGDTSSAVLISNHGAVVGGRNLTEAVVAAQVLEKVSLILVHSTQLDSLKSIPDELVKEERHRFLYKYGKE